jgi:predicted dienelactone hydrolase
LRFRFCSRSVTLAAAIVAACANVPARAEASEAAGAPTPVGFTDMSVAGNTALRGDAANRLHVVVWYPARVGTPVRPLEVGPPGAPLFSEGDAAEDAPIATEPVRLPFVVVSHGTGGTARDLSWLCADLAAHGYLVASVDHPGNNALEAPTVAGTTLWWMRADDLSRTIDGVLADARFGPRVDRARIGAAGFSLGGLTVLMLGGARADVTKLDAYCAANPVTPACSGVATPTIPNLGARARELAASDPAYRAALLANADDHRDPRVKAIFSIAPALGPAIVRESLAALHLPVAMVDGMGDPIVPVADNAIPDALALPDATLTLFPQAVGHYTFLTDCAAAGKIRFAPICEDAGPGRVAVHAATAALAEAFFARTLRP